MRPHFYKLDEHGQPIACEDIQDWGQWFHTAERRVCQDMDEGEGADRVHISTVFLGIDHNFRFDGPPVLWETLVFGGPLDGEMDRYDSLEAAIVGHQAMCLRVRAAMSDRQ